MASQQTIDDKTASYDWKSSLARLKGAYSDGTLRAYQTDIQGYINWCNLQKIRAFPAQPNSIANFIENEANVYSPSTLKRRLAAIGKMHSLFSLSNPCQHIDVIIALKRSLRLKGSRPRQALGLNAKMRDQLIESCNNSLSGKRNKAIFSVGYDTLCRRSEIVEIQIEDIEIKDDKVGRILIRRSKCDQHGVGRISQISPRSIKYINSWLKASKLECGPLFRGIKQNKIQSNGLHPHSISRIIKYAAKKAGFSNATIKLLSSHSMRIGAAQDMMTLGFDILPIMVAGGWKSTNVLARYVENADKSVMLNRFFENNL